MASSPSMIPAKFKELNDYLKGNCEDISKYDIICKIGQGTYGEVYKGVNKETKQIVAMKKVIAEDVSNDLPYSVLNEFRILSQCNNPNIISLLGMCRGTPKTPTTSSTSFFLCLEFCQTDLNTLIRDTRTIITLAHARHVLRDIIRGLYYLHHNEHVHRDIKPENILITNGTAKLADFGSAVDLQYEPGPREKAGTCSFMAPEILLGETKCHPSSDMWSVGVTFAELLMRRSLFKDDTNFKSQLLQILDLCGPISPILWPGVERLPDFRMVNNSRRPTRKVRQLILKYERDLKVGDLMDKLLTLDPSKRMSSQGALWHEFFNAI